MKVDIAQLRDKILSGGRITDAEAMSLARTDAYDPEELYEAAAEVTRRKHSRHFDTCSIINARSGHCGEDCKWCAQAARHHTGALEYPLVDRDTCIALGQYNNQRGIGRFSFVTSGRKLGGASLDTLCSYYKELKQQCPEMGLCASMGLLGAGELAKLKEAGVERYHCNMETAPSHFPTLCSTHSQADKLATIREARRAGLSICSGGIIGMGETLGQRIEFALFLRAEVQPVSIPINILVPIPGTPLEGMAPLSSEEILTTVAVFRLVHPHAVLRFAGGRVLIDPDTQRRALTMGVNGAIIGDLLTTLGASIDQDMQMAQECGYQTSGTHED
ncbi:MAG: biotin synthase BioB [Muribaculaceae bacterium]|nr:biotin synthase BioB [Muribaculaceae bacterium]